MGRFQTIRYSVLLIALWASFAAPSLAEPERVPNHRLLRFLGGVMGSAGNIHEAAMDLYRNAPRYGSCSTRRKQFLAVADDAIRYAGLSRAVYSADLERAMHAENLTTLDLGDGRRAYYSLAGKRYAEIQMEQDLGRLVVVFRGTRILVSSDVTTDILNMMGIETAYYDWAATLVGQLMEEHPNLQVIATGDSLGGGLAIHAVLNNPGAKAYVFNAAGLPLERWAAASDEDRQRTNEAVKSFSIRSSIRIEPSTMLSFAGRTVLPGQIFVIKVSSILPRRLHSIKTMITELRRASSSRNNFDCDDNLGILADWPETYWLPEQASEH